MSGRRITRRGWPGPRRLIGVVAAAGVVAACASPEAERVQGGGPGADPGNRDPVVEIHAGALMYAGTPCMTSLPECHGPEAASGLSGDGEFARPPEEDDG